MTDSKVEDKVRRTCIRRRSPAAVDRSAVAVLRSQLSILGQFKTALKTFFFTADI